MKRTLTYILLSSLIGLVSNADTVTTNDGAQLKGTITLVDKGIIYLDTSYAGNLKIKQNQVLSFESENPHVLRLHNGTIIAGMIKGTSEDNIRIQSKDGTVETNILKVAAAWSLDKEDPEAARHRRKWRYDSSFDLTGKTGNADKIRFGTNLKARLKGPDDALAFFFEYEQSEEEATQTENRIATGGSYESYSSEVDGWYVRSELEKDAIDRVDLRSTSAAGLSYRAINNEQQSLVFKSGLGYRYTAYDNGAESESSAALDIGLSHDYQFKDSVKMKNEITLVPAIYDLSNLRLVHDSGLEIPYGREDDWKIRIGIKNEYVSQTEAIEKLDTSYYTRILYSWE